MEDMITVEQAAEIIGVSAVRIRQFIKEERLPATKIGEGRRGMWLINRADLEKVKDRPKAGRPRGKGD